MAATVKLNSLPGYELARPYDYGPIFPISGFISPDWMSAFSSEVDTGSREEKRVKTTG
jgi:hypothetical protein